MPADQFYGWWICVDAGMVNDDHTYFDLVICGALLFGDYFNTINITATMCIDNMYLPTDLKDTYTYNMYLLREIKNNMRRVVYISFEYNHKLPFVFARVDISGILCQALNISGKLTLFNFDP